MGSFDPQAYQGHGPNEANHDHPFTIPGMPELVQLAQALGGGMFPGMGSGQNDTMPNQDSVAPGFPLNLFFVVPQNQVKQQAVKLTFQPSPYRTYISANAHNHPGDTVANESSHAHAGDTHSSHSHAVISQGLSHGNTGNETGGHLHGMPIIDRGAGAGGSTVFANTGNNDLEANLGIGGGTFSPQTGTDVAIGSNDHVHGAPGAHGGHNHSYVDITSVPLTNTGAGAAHGHTPGTTGNATQDGVHEGTSPDAMHVLVDGADVTANLGGPFATAQTNLDISPYVAAGTGIHTVQVTSTTNLGRVSGWVRNSSIINAMNPV